MEEETINYIYSKMVRYYHDFKWKDKWKSHRMVKSMYRTQLFLLKVRFSAERSYYLRKFNTERSYYLRKFNTEGEWKKMKLLFIDSMQKKKEAKLLFI